MRKLPFLLFFINLFLFGPAWAQIGLYPLGSSHGNASSNARIQTTAPFQDTLQLPFIYDFNDIYLQIDSISASNGVTIIVNTFNIHGLKNNDCVYLTFSQPPNNVATPADPDLIDVTKYIKKLSKYSFQLYDDSALTIPSKSSTTLEYMRISRCNVIRPDRLPDTLTFFNNNGGVVVTPGSGMNPLSRYNASFDGLNANGIPYSATALATGYTDSLRSQPFDFSAYLPSDSIYMSFFYQHGGYGEEPDPTDHLYLEFLDNTNNWNQVYNLTGANSGSIDSFYSATTPITDPKYLHRAFQYRFRSYGRQSGMYDVWNLNFIYIDKGRTLSTSRVNDISIGSGNESFLKKYTAMPFNHFFSNTSAYINDTVSFKVTQQYPKKFFNTMIPAVRLIDNLHNFVHAETTGYIHNGPTFKDSLISIPLSGTFNFPATPVPMYVDQECYIQDAILSDYAKGDTLYVLDNMFNNKITNRTYLYDYYAYDDSEAERAFGSNLAGTRLAVRYTSAIKDTLTHIDICFARGKSDSDLEGSQIYLNVWDSNFDTLLQNVIAIHYQPYLNGFYRYQLSRPLVLNAGQVFNVGYTQYIADYLYVGYDRNCDATANMYFSYDGTSWSAMNDSTITAPIQPGSMMIRPVFYKVSNHISTGILQGDNTPSKNGLLLYPNPASSSVRIVTQTEIQTLTYSVYSLYGQVLLSGIIKADNNTIDIADLSAGMYLIKCTDEKNKAYLARFIKE